MQRTSGNSDAKAERRGYGVAPPERLETMLLADGRSLAWAEWGPMTGLPVLFCTGAGMSRWLGFAAADVDSLGVRLIALDRPGLGASDPHPAKTLESWAGDALEFSRANGLRDPTAVGFSQGAPFALALGGRNVVDAVALVSGQDDLAHPHFAERLDPDVARMVSAVRTDPAGFEREFAGFATAEGLWRLVVGMSSQHDRAVYLDETFSAAYRRSLQEGFAQGAHGYARDLVNALGPWPVPPERITVSVDLSYGAKDASTVHSPDLGAWLEARLLRATWEVFAEEGGSLLWRRSRDILLKLTAHAASR